MGGIGPAGRYRLAQSLSMRLIYYDSQTTICSSHFIFSPDTMTETVVFAKNLINSQLYLQADHEVVGEIAVCSPRLKEKS